MSEYNEVHTENEPDPSEELFGRSKSRNEILEEQKAEKKAAKAAEKEARRTAKAERKNAPKESRPEIRVMGGVLALVVVFCLVALGVQFHQEKKNSRFERDETAETYFLNAEATPELSEEGLTAAVTQAYYTKGDYLCVQMTLGNGLDKDQHLNSIEVKIHNGENDQLIASGYTAEVSESYTVPAKGMNTYTFYISPEHVSIHDDPLTSISYTITAKGTIIQDKK